MDSRVASAPAHRARRPGSTALPSDLDASGRSFGLEELEAVSDALVSGTLSGVGGRWVSRLEESFARVVGTRFALASSSGSSAVHAAIAALDPEPGDEVVVSPLADMDVLMPILFQGAVPVFADVDPLSGNLTAESIRRQLAERTRAILVTHLLGQPCEMEPIMSLAASRRIPVIEDCSQALLAQTSGSCVGTLGAMGCFDLRQDRHVTCGEGGLVVTANEELARRVSTFIHKVVDGEEAADHRCLGLDGRMSELQAAVAAAQVEKLPRLVAERVARATELSELLADVSGITPQVATRGTLHTFWRFPLLVHREVAGGARALAGQLAKRGVSSSPQRKPAFRHSVFSNQKTFGRSGYPFSMARRGAVDYRNELYPGAFRFLRDVLWIPFNERFAPSDVTRIAAGVRDSVAELC